jgi:hypothetical protein
VAHAEAAALRRLLLFTRQVRGLELAGNNSRSLNVNQINDVDKKPAETT